MTRPGRAAGDLLQQAIESLSRAAGERLARHPLGHLANGRGDRLELTLQIPVNAAGGLDDAVGEARSSLEREIEGLLAHRAAFQPGRVLCIRCASAECEHSVPGSPRQVFAGYGATGIAQYQDFGQWLLERQHPEIDRLYRRPPRLVTGVASGVELTGQLLGAFREKRLDYRIHGQVAAGWFAIPGSKGSTAGGQTRQQPGGAVALTFQVLSTARKGRRGRRGRGRRSGRRRLGLNILGTGPAGEPLAELYDRLDAIPWAEAVRWSQQALDSIERSQGKKSATPERLSGRIEGVLNGIARRLEHHRRSRDRRTGHAQKRHREGDRPTDMALKDLARAGDGSVLFDLRRETLIVLGDKGRAHVWGAAGKLVTSIRYSPDSIEKKKKLEIWRQATAQEIAALRQAVS